MGKNKQHKNNVNMNIKGLKLDVDVFNIEDELLEISTIIKVENLTTFVDKMLNQLFENGLTSTETVSIDFVIDRIRYYLREGLFLDEDDYNCRLELRPQLEALFKRYAEWKPFFDNGVLDDFIINVLHLKKFISYEERFSKFCKKSNRKDDLKKLIYYKFDGRKHLKFKIADEPACMHIADIYQELSLLCTIFYVLYSFYGSKVFDFVNNKVFEAFLELIKVSPVSYMKGCVDLPLIGCNYIDLYYEFSRNFYVYDTYSIKDVSVNDKKKSIEIKVDNNLFYSKAYTKELHIDKVPEFMAVQDDKMNDKRQAIVRIIEGNRANVVRLQVELKGFRVISRVATTDGTANRRFPLFDLWETMGSGMRNPLGHYVGIVLSRFDFVKDGYKHSYLSSFEKYVEKCASKQIKTKGHARGVVLDTALEFSLAMMPSYKECNALINKVYSDYARDKSLSKRALSDLKRRKSELKARVKLLRRMLAHPPESIAIQFVECLREIRW